MIKSHERPEDLLMALLMYGRRMPNSPRWLSFTVPQDFVDEVEKYLATMMSNQVSIQDFLGRPMSERMSLVLHAKTRNIEGTG